jgi:UDP-2,3-diacylglucosamine pyrophosphatase LpxH
VTDIKNLFISDAHLGSRHAATSELLDFLTRVKDESPPEKLYIVGDFIDGWKLRRNWYWNNDHNLIIRKILSLVRRDTEIYYIAGNHDEFLRDFIDVFSLLEFGNIKLGNEFIHDAVNGSKILVTHGDAFDMVTKYGRWLCWLGDIGYDLLLWANRFVNRVRRIFRRKKHWSLSKAIKHNVKKAVNYVSNFEHVLTEHARSQGCNGCLCGHIHTAALNRLEDGFIYMNTGDWVESCTAIIEGHDGRFSLYHHRDGQREYLAA